MVMAMLALMPSAAQGGEASAPADEVSTLLRDTSGFTVALTPEGTEITKPYDTPIEILGRAFTSEDDFSDPASYMGAAGLIYLKSLGSRALTLSAADVDPGASDHEAWPAGDLDGDGLDDVLVVETAYAGETATYSVHAVRGTDGAGLWSKTYEGTDGILVLPSVGDLTGDGMADPLVQSLQFGLEEAYECVEWICYYHQGISYTWTFDAISGADGIVAWTRTYNGSLQYLFAGGFNADLVMAAGANAAVATNVATFAEVAGDHDGDGLPDLVFNAIDVASGGAGSAAYDLNGGFAFAQAYSQRLITTGEVISGVDGSVLYLGVQPSTSGNAFELLAPAGDAVGDSTEDLVWWSLTNELAGACFFSAGELGETAACPPSPPAIEGIPAPGQGVLTVRMLDGSTFLPAWQFARPLGEGMDFAALATWAPAGDPTGDGKADLFFYEVDWESGGRNLGVVSGADGSLAWVHSGGGQIMFPIGPLDGGAGDDIVNVGVDFAGGLSLYMERLDGASGDLLLTTEHVAAPVEGFGFIWLGVSPLGDADGDGVGDLLHGSSTTSFGPEGPTSAAKWFAESATGVTMFEKRTNAETRGFPAGDINGDGLADFYHVAAGQFDGTSGGVTFDGVSPVSGATLWSRTDTFADFFSIGVEAVGDLTGDGNADALYQRFQWSWPTLTRADVLDGASGTLSWGVGDAL